MLALLDRTKQKMGEEVNGPFSCFKGRNRQACPKFLRRSMGEPDNWELGILVNENESNGSASPREGKNMRSRLSVSCSFAPHYWRKRAEKLGRAETYLDCKYSKLHGYFYLKMYLPHHRLNSVACAIPQSAAHNKLYHRAHNRWGPRATALLIG